jgi:putative transposase
MPSGLKRFHNSGQAHFITFTCYHRLPYLLDEQLCQTFLNALEKARKRFLFLVFGFVLMPEHVHLVISEPERRTVATAIQSLKLSTSLLSSHRKNRESRSPLWQPRYYDRNLRDYQEFVEKLRYIHRNPVKRGRALAAEDWRWSSFRHHLSGEDCKVEIESKWTAAKRKAEA